jgi:enamine deaminase RidA (YjgF/YER057c/UK114 family)
VGQNLLFDGDNTLVDKKEIIMPDELHHLERWPYSHGVKVGDMLFIAGQVALDEDLQLVGENDAEAQSRQIWQNIQAVVEAAGGKVTDVVRVTLFVLDFKHMPAFHKVRKEIFPNGGYPAATGVQIVKLGLPGLLLEIEATAVIGSS